MINRTTRTVFFIFLILASGFGQFTRKQNIKTNLDRFTIFGVMKSHPSRDSINAAFFVDIPNFAVQFIKTNEGFVSKYDVQLSVLNEKNKQTHQFLWSETVITDKYLKTMSLDENRLFYKQIPLPNRPFNIKVEIMDRDTRKRAHKDLKFTPELHVSGDLAIFPSVILHRERGNWGFGEGYLPVLQEQISYKTDSIAIFVSGWARDGKVQVELMSESETEPAWFHQDSVIVENGYFKYQHSLPATDVSALLNKIYTTVSQGRFSAKDIKELKFRKQGMSIYVQDINRALEQMKYILTHEEKSRLNKTPRKDKEALFKELWVTRDPTPETPVNELMDEYYRRVAFTNEYFTSFQQGWETDMGMVYILMGPPDDRNRETFRNSRIIEETWYYFRINQSYTFRDRDGFGDFTLTTPFLY